MAENDKFMPCQRCNKPDALTPFEYMNAIPCEECIREDEEDAIRDDAIAAMDRAAFVKPK